MSAATQVPGVRFSANGSNHITKRDGREEVFDRHKVVSAVKRCVINSLGTPEEEAEAVAQDISRRVETILVLKAVWPVGVEDVQRLVIQQLWANEHFAAAEQYQNYREEHRRARETRPVRPDHARAVAEDSGHFPTDLQYYQFVGKFARWREEDQRRETWREACDRVTGWFRRRPRISLTDQEWAELDASLYGLETCCAMRVLQMAGPALDRCNVGAYNCLRRDTKFVTRDGVKSFEDFEDGDRTFVRSHTGAWRMATVRCYGTGTVYPVTFGRGQTKHVVYATSDHRWVHRDGHVSQGVRKGDLIWKAPMTAAGWSYDDAEPFGKLAWCYGYVYGDGTRVKKAGEYRYSMVRLCGSDAVRYVNRFEEMGFATSQPLSFGGDVMCYTGSYQKTLPQIEEKIEYLRAFVRGWLDADAAKQTSSTSCNEFPSMQVTGTTGIDFVRRVFPMVGVYLSREDDLTDQSTNYGPRSEVTVRFGLFNNAGDAANSHFRVLDVGARGEVTDVWCLEVNQDHSFVLPNGVVTGNCSYHPIQDIFAFAELLYILMQGTGSGFSVEHEYVGELPKVKRQRKRARPELYRIEDDTEAWCDALKFGMERWFEGYDVTFDDSPVRPAGSRLKTKGGRSSGPLPLRELLRFTRSVVLSRQGGVLTDLDCHDICCMGGKIVQVGGVRRASCISISELDSQPMREAKSGNWYERAKWRTMANNSAAYDGRPDDVAFMREWLSLAESGSGERGIFNRKAVELSLPKRRKKGQEWGMNPCLVGGTLVYTADGRRGVTIRQLAEEGKDVPVFCRDEDDRLTVRMMRHPRVTGVRQPVHKVTLDDGLTIRVTAGHRFLLRDRTYREARDLRPGDSLALLTQTTPEACVGEGRGDLYVGLQYHVKSPYYEHRLIAEFAAGREVLSAEHVHHLDGDRLNNRAENLSILDANAHLSGHGSGDGNPNYGGVDNVELVRLGRDLTRSLGRRFSTVEWTAFARDYGLPMYFGEWRQKSLGTVLALSRRCAALEGVDGPGDADPRVIRTYQRMLDAGLDAEIIDGEVLVHKVCEICRDAFTVSHRRREQSCCSYGCSSRARSPETQQTMNRRLKEAHENRRELRRHQQLEVYTSLKNDLGRDPLKKEWVDACKKAGISAEVCRPSSPFTSWQALVEKAASFNHRVVSVEEDGFEDVYNGTVDDFHNFFVGGWDGGLTECGRRRTWWICNANCGEIILRPFEFCNLSICVARHDDTRETLRKKVRLAAYWGCMQKTCTDFRYIRPDWKKNCEEEALLGVDITGHADCPLLRYGAPGRAELLREFRRVVAEVDEDLSGRWGVNRSAADTCVKPGGDSSVFFDCASGVSDRYAAYQIRWVRESMHSPVAGLLVEEGVPHAAAPEDPSLLVFGFPRKAPEGSTLRNDHTAVQQLENWLEWKRNWAEHSVACTIYVAPHEWVAVGNWVLGHFDEVTGLSFLPRDNGIYSYAPNEEITREQYEEMARTFPKINWAKLARFEEFDQTTSSREFACVGDRCGG